MPEPGDGPSFPQLEYARSEDEWSEDEGSEAHSKPPLRNERADQNALTYYDYNRMYPGPSMTPGTPSTPSPPVTPRPDSERMGVDALARLFCLRRDLFYAAATEP